MWLFVRAATATVLALASIVASIAIWVDILGRGYGLDGKAMRRSSSRGVTIFIGGIGADYAG
jgi:hypothetical protein